MRTAAKAHTFKPLYGGESGTKSEKAYYAEFKRRYSGLADAQERWVDEVLSTKRLITPWGMRYYWPRAKRNQHGYVNVKSSIYNYPVQAFATAEIIPVALVALRRRLQGESGVKFVNTVHDSVILEVHPDAMDRVREAAVEAFGMDVYKYLREVYDYEFTVPLGCGITIGSHWSEGPEESYNIWPDGRREKVE
jgi:DNA polymerase I-like protein with 3'-5' exonuclease and polymerase domains